MRVGVIVCAAALALASPAAAQRQSTMRPEIRPTVAAFVPTGTFGDHFKSAPAYGGQLALEFSKYATVVGSVSWMPMTQKLIGFDDKVDTWMYDVGLELARPQPLNETWDFKPFLSGGIGGMSYDYRSSALSSQHQALGFVGLGTELQVGRSALRLEVRDVMSSYRIPAGTRTREGGNAVTFGIGYAFHLW